MPASRDLTKLEYAEIDRQHIPKTCGSLRFVDAACNTEDRYVPLRVFVMFRRLRVWMQDLAQLAQVHFAIVAS